MKIVTKISELKQEILAQRLNSKTIGFVPTMGALHSGHLSLLEYSQKYTDYSVVSIFVNPTQFNNPDDLRKYPRTIETDKSLLESQNCDLLFVPDEKEMYPEKDERVFDFNGIETVMEGKFRHGHFNGVAQIVSKFFEAIQPDKAFFGEKDFQQVAIIKYLSKKYLPHLKIEIVSCPIVREGDGLAMSSRNMRLDPEYRKIAPEIYQTLSLAQQMKNLLSVYDLKQWVVDTINKNNKLKVEYFEVVDNETLLSIENWTDSISITGCIAVFAGDVRLIDNIKF